ncbi:UNVERIFIED_CONTAM: hypothetical protein GTU68_049268 [Idotea baltica]|nr:hypothetical protein [Idotea baltica]
MYRYVKPILETIAAALLLLLLSPVFIGVTIVLTFANSGSPFFSQKRGGKNQTVFNVIKFRTMNNRKGADGQLLPDADRLTTIGKVVRSTSLDELPQLVNVLKGEMGLIGPRPFIADYLELYDDFQKRRHEVRPGITGWAQVNGRNNLAWPEKFKLDVWYVDNVSFMLDAKIFFMTLAKLIRRSDVNEDGQVTTVRFTGNATPTQ